jgi:hypothetical protein
VQLEACILAGIDREVPQSAQACANKFNGFHDEIYIFTYILSTILYRGIFCENYRKFITGNLNMLPQKSTKPKQIIDSLRLRSITQSNYY